MPEIGVSVMKRMLINATQSEELRVAVVDGQKLQELEIEFSLRPEKKGNIYKGIVTRIEPSLDAVFVDYSEERNGFLPCKEIANTYYNDKKTIDIGKEILVQVVKDERGSKGASLTTFISLAGRYIVLMPMSPNTGGVSRRADAKTRNAARESLEQLEIPDKMGVIIRTAGIGRDPQDLTWDLNYLKQLWQAVIDYSIQEHKPELIYQESSLVIRAIRDYFHSDIHEILIDTEEVYNQALGFISYVMPSYTSRIKLYKDGTPLFSRFQVEHQIETAYSRTVSLPSGGSIVIDRTEALVAIDINSSRATRAQDVEQTALTTNIEAAEEIARQLRLRDLGGLIVIDFIDMESFSNQREVENKIRECVQSDRARIQIQKLSRFGLMELSRQRLQPSLGESSNVVCSRCGGAGSIRSTDSFALQAIREIENESLKENTGKITIQLPIEVASYLLNEKRNDIQRIELRSGVNVVIIPNKFLETPQYSIERLRHDELNDLTEIKSSYLLVEENKPSIDKDNRLQNIKPQQKPQIKPITPDRPAPEIQKSTKKSGGFFAWIKSFFENKSTTKAIPNRNYPNTRRDRNFRKKGRNERNFSSQANRDNRNLRTGRISQNENNQSIFEKKSPNRNKFRNDRFGDYDKKSRSNRFNKFSLEKNDDRKESINRKDSNPVNKDSTSIKPDNQINSSGDISISSSILETTDQDFQSIPSAANESRIKTSIEQEDIVTDPQRTDQDQKILPNKNKDDIVKPINDSFEEEQNFEIAKSNKQKLPEGMEMIETTNESFQENEQVEEKLGREIEINNEQIQNKNFQQVETKP